MISKALTPPEFCISKNLPVGIGDGGAVAAWEQGEERGKRAVEAADMETHKALLVIEGSRPLGREA